MAAGKVRTVLITLLVVVIVVVAAVVIYTDRLVKVGVETAGTQALGVPTSVGGANLSLLGGSLGLDELEVDNPTGFTSKNFLAVNRFDGRVDIGSLLQETVRVEQIRLEGLVLTVEQKGLDSNVAVVLKRIRELTGSDEAGEPEQASKGRNWFIERIEIVEPRAKLRLLPLGGDLTESEVALGSIRLEGLSSETDKGELAVTVVQRIVVAVIDAVLSGAGQDLPAGLRGQLESAVGPLKAVLDVTASAVVEKAGKALTEGVEKIEKGLGETSRKLFDSVTPGSKKPDDAAPK